MRFFMDEIRFEEGGTVVHMHKRSNGGSVTHRRRKEQ
jgi:hypothetical protein